MILDVEVVEQPTGGCRCWKFDGRVLNAQNIKTKRFPEKAITKSPYLGETKFLASCFTI
jgi:hypothetical protein